MSLLESYASVGAKYGLKIAETDSIMDVNHQLWVALVNCWNQSNMTEEQRENARNTVSLRSDGT